MSPSKDVNCECISRVPYPSVGDNLMCAKVCARLDISHVVSMISHHRHNHGKAHWRALK